MAFLIIFSVFYIYIPFAKAETKACCENTKSGENCVFTSIDNCDSSGMIAYTTCEQTNFCNLGCCYSSSDGSCNRNTPKAVCNSKESAAFIESPECSIGACQKGCCLIGDQAFFVTQTQCKQYGTQFPDLKVLFDNGITTEKACLEKSRSQEIGCCVTEDSCSFTTRDACNTASENLENNAAPKTNQNSNSQPASTTQPAAETKDENSQESEKPAEEANAEEKNR